MHLSTHSLSPAISAPLTAAEVQAFQVSCQQFIANNAANSPELTQVASQMLTISQKMQALSEKAEAFLSRYR